MTGTTYKACLAVQEGQANLFSQEWILGAPRVQLVWPGGFDFYSSVSLFKVMLQSFRVSLQTFKSASICFIVAVDDESL